MPPLYPKRQFQVVSEVAPTIKELKPRKLSPEQYQEFKSWENSLGERLESIVNKINKYDSRAIMYPVFFNTRAGQKIFEQITGEKFQDTQQLLEIAQSLPEEKLKKLATASRNFFDKIAQKTFERQAKEALDFKLPDIFLEYIPVLIYPEEISDAHKKLRIFKAELKQKLTQESSEIKRDFLKLYLRRVNHLIAYTAMLLYAHLRAKQKHISRYDMFIHGAEKRTKLYSVVTQELEELAKKVDQMQLEELINKNAHLKEKGIDPEKFDSITFNAIQVARLIDKLLKYYSIDDWKVEVTDDKVSMSISSPKKTIYVPLQIKATAQKAIAVACAHEVEGHVFQHINR